MIAFVLRAKLISPWRTGNGVGSAGTGVLLAEGLPVFVYEYNHYADDTEEYLLADGTVELNDIAVNGEWSKAATWCCRINEHGVRDETP